MNHTLHYVDFILPFAKYFNNTQEHLSSTSPQMRSTVITAFKFTIIDQVRSINCIVSNIPIL